MVEGRGKEEFKKIREPDCLVNCQYPDVYKWGSLTIEAIASMCPDGEVEKRVRST